jgi:hypothetical protein
MTTNERRDVDFVRAKEARMRFFGWSEDVAAADVRRAFGLAAPAVAAARMQPSPAERAQTERFRAGIISFRQPSADALRRLATFTEPPDPYERALEKRAGERR